jgi:hypothetical protein
MPWLYFGCGPRESGHYLYTESGQKLHHYGRPDSFIMQMCWDGNLAPQPEPAPDTLIYRAALSRLGGWGYSALSWWDRSADKRGKSNSTILAPNLAIEPAAMLDEAKRRFPWVFSRLPQALAILP